MKNLEVYLRIVLLKLVMSGLLPVPRGSQSRNRTINHINIWMEVGGFKYLELVAGERTVEAGWATLGQDQDQCLVEDVIISSEGAAQK